MDKEFTESEIEAMVDDIGKAAGTLAAAMATMAKALKAIGDLFTDTPQEVRVQEFTDRVDLVLDEHKVRKLRRTTKPGGKRAVKKLAEPEARQLSFMDMALKQSATRGSNATGHRIKTPIIQFRSLLRRIMDKFKLTQSQLSHVLCVHPTAVSKWMRGKNCMMNMRATLIRKLATQYTDDNLPANLRERIVEARFIYPRKYRKS